jgi:hypothetical protein
MPASAGDRLTIAGPDAAFLPATDEQTDHRSFVFAAATRRGFPALV